jgi:hypothetical protein
MAVKPPIRFVKDPSEETRIRNRYWYEVLLRAWKLHIRPQGIGFDEMLAGIEREHPEIERRLSDGLRENRTSETAWILVDESTRKKDLDSYFRMVSERHGSRPDKGRDRRDRTTCVECAVLHMQHGWTPERLAQRYRWASPHDAENYIKDGRAILNGRERG